MSPTDCVLFSDRVAKMDSVIFVDVDGVLNVGIQDDLGAPLLLNKGNILCANEMRGARHNGAGDRCVERLLSACDRKVGCGEKASTYADLACDDSSHVSGILAARLAEIISSAGENRAVVLSSNWRRPSHRTRVTNLEKEISKHLGSSFSFDAATPLCDERRAAERLRCIGNFLEEMCKRREAGAKPLRALVLEDFFITALDGWRCGGQAIDCEAKAEDYLKSRATAFPNLAVKLVHTYDEWKMPCGLTVQVGAGITEEQVVEAQDFLATTGDAEDVAVLGEEDVVAEPSVVEPPKLTAGVTRMVPVNDKSEGKAARMWDWFDASTALFSHASLGCVRVV